MNIFFFLTGKRAKLTDSVSQQDLLLHDNTEIGQTVIPEIVVPEDMELKTSVMPDLLTEVMMPNDIKVYNTGILFCLIFYNIVGYY